MCLRGGLKGCSGRIKRVHVLKSDWLKTCVVLCVLRRTFCILKDSWLWRFFESYRIVLKGPEAKEATVDLGSGCVYKG